MTSTTHPASGPEQLDELGLPELPEAQATLAAEREHRKRQLAATFRVFARYGYDEGVAGHITARDPELPDHFWVNPFGVHFSRIRVSDLLLIDEAGRVVHGERRTNKAAFHIHSAIHRARPDVVAVAHAHTVHGRAYAALDRLIEPMVQEACAFYDDHILFASTRGSSWNAPRVSGSPSNSARKEPRSCATTAC